MTKNSKEINIETKGRELLGEVVSDVAEKTVVVKVNRFVKHPKYKKYFKKSKRYQAHDANNEYKIGDKVIIKETKPISKTKSFFVLAKQEK